MKLLPIILFCSSHLFSQNWLQLTDFPGLERDDGIAVTLNNKLYFGSGLTVGWALSKDFYSLDPTTNTWSAITSLPNGAERQYACAFAGVNSFFVFGGDGIGGALNSLLKYDSATNTWSVMASKPGNGLLGAGCLEFGDKVIIVGGKIPGNIVSNEVWEYTISTNTWTQKNNFPFGGRFRPGAAVASGTGYLVFGIDNTNRYRKEMYSYNQNTDSWTGLQDFPLPKGRAYAALKNLNGTLLMFGGYDSLGVYHKDVWQYNTAFPGWQQNQDFISFGRKGGMSAVAGNKFYYTCGVGINGSEVRLKETWVLDVPVGIKENKNLAVYTVYPNPADEFINIDVEEQTQDPLFFSLTDVGGRELKQAKATDGALQIADLEPGIYLLKVLSGNTCLGLTRVIKK
ncbi:MAG: kelch repeat-containing protein [Bacteroidota bacterium]